MKVLGKLLNTHFLSHQMLEEDCFLLLEFLQEKNIKQFFLSRTVKGDDGNMDCKLWSRGCLSPVSGHN